MHAMNDMLHIWTKLNHTNSFMNASSSLFKNFRYALVIKKILILVYIKKKIIKKKIRSVFVNLKKWFWFIKD